MEFIYLLRLVERLKKAEDWTEKDNAIVGEHFQHLLNLKDQGKLILAGKTAGQDKDTFGVTIFVADSLDEAHKIKDSDPAIKKGIMTARLWEYNLAVFNNEYKKD